MSQRELAGQAALSLRALRNLEQGRVRRPHPSSVRRLSEALQLPYPESDRLPGAADALPDGPRLDIGVLGPLVVNRRDWTDTTAAKARHLLGLLAIRPGQQVPSDEIVDVLWGTHPPAAWQQSLHHYVWQLRKLLEPGRPRRAAARTLIRTSGSYLLELSIDELDLLRFDRLASRARGVDSSNDPERAVQLWAEALRCWRGRVLADLGAPLRLHPAAVAASGRRLAATLAHADLAISLGRCEQAVECLRAVAADEPLHEGVHARLMLALAGCGQQAAALATFAELRARLADELGVQPGAEIQQAHLRVLRQDIPSSAPPAPVHVNVPRGRVPPAQLPADVPGFTGRTEQIAELDALLAARGDGRRAAVLVTAIGGTAGVGKTAMAVHWAHRVADRFGDGQLYVNLRGFDQGNAPVDPAEALRGFLDALGMPSERIPITADAQVDLYRSLVADRRVLILLDNARDAEQVRPLLPGTSSCLTLVTSRNDLSGLVAIGGAHPLTLDLLSPDEAGALLAARLDRRRLAAEPEAVDEIVRRCAGLPLALAIVAARAATRPGFPLAAIAGELSAESGRLDVLGGVDPATDIRAVFSWSFRTLGASAARLFRQLGLHPGPDVAAPAAASLARIPPRQVHQSLAELAAANLIREHLPGRYGLHDLLRAYAAELAHAGDPDDESQAALHRMCDHYLHTAHAAAVLLDPTREPISLVPAASGVTPEVLADREQALAWLTVEHPVLLAVVDHAARAGLDVQTWQLAWTLAKFLDRQGRWDEVLATQHAALASARRLTNRDWQAHNHRRLGQAYVELNRYEEAHAQFRRALDLSAQLRDDAAQAHIHLGIVVVFDHQGRYGDALRHAEQALDLYRAAGHRSGEAYALNSIGWVCAKLGDHRRALTRCRQALTVHEEVGDRWGEAETWDSLGYVHHIVGDHAEAADCYRHAVDMCRLIGDRYYEANTLSNLGDTHHAAGNRGAARDAWQHALRILDELGDPGAEALRAKLGEQPSARSGELSEPDRTVPPQSAARPYGGTAPAGR